MSERRDEGGHGDGNENGGEYKKEATCEGDAEDGSLFDARMGPTLT